MKVHKATYFNPEHSATITEMCRKNSLTIDTVKTKKNWDWDNVTCKRCLRKSPAARKTRRGKK